MRVVIIHQHYAIQRYQETIDEIIKNYPNCEVHLIVPKRIKLGIDIKAEPLNSNIKLHTLNAPFARLGKQHLFFFIGLHRLLDKLDPQLIWAQAPNSINTWQAAKYCEKHKIPLLLLRFSNYVRDYRKLHSVFDPRRYVFEKVRRYTYKVAKGIVVIDDLVEGVVRAEGFSGKIFKYMTMGVGKAFFDVGKDRLNDKSEPKKILFLGRLMPAKGIKYLIDAYMQLNFENTTLTIVGSGPCLNDLQAQAAADKSIEFIPFISYEKVPEFLRSFDIIVLPSITEGKALEQFGRVIVEGQAAGLVAIGTDIGGIPNAVRDGGLLVPERSSEALHDALKSLISHPEMFFDLRQKAFNSANKNFSEREVARNFYLTFKRILDA